MGPPAPGRGKSPQAACCALCVHRGSETGQRREATKGKPVPNVSGEYQQSCCLKDSWKCFFTARSEYQQERVHSRTGRQERTNLL
jgi:hypothetical protein